jgi:hypothetical protein
MSFPGLITRIYLCPIIDNKVGEEGSSDDEYNPKAKRQKGKRKQSAVTPASTAENARANAHTLNENHDIFLTNSFDASFGGSGANIIPSSQNDNFGFDMFFGAFDDLDIGEGVGDDLVMELGEGWGGAGLNKQIECVSCSAGEHLTEPPSNDMQMYDQIDFEVNDADNPCLEHDILTDNASALNQNILALPPSVLTTPQGTQRNSAGTTNHYI